VLCNFPNPSAGARGIRGNASSSAYRAWWPSLPALLIALTVVLVPAVSHAAESAHRVVFEVSADGQDQWQFILTNIDNLRVALGPEQTQVAVVAYGKGLGMLLAANADMQERLARLAQSGVTLAACQNTMRRLGITEKDLFPFVTTVDSGVAEIVRKQEAGWAYIKGGR